MNAPHTLVPRWWITIGTRAVVRAALCMAVWGPPASAADLPPEQADALAAIERALERNLKAGERGRQAAYNDAFTSPRYGTRSVLRARSDWKGPEAIPDSVNEGAIVGLSFAIEEDLGCGCCFGDVPTDIGDDAMVQVAALADLRILRLHRTKVTGTGLRHLARLKHLQQLDVSGLSLNDDDMDAIASVESLEELNIAGTKVTDEGLRKLSALAHLRSLNFEGTVATGEGLDAFSRHGQLRLAIGGPQTRKALDAYAKVGSLERMTVDLTRHVEIDRTSEMHIPDMPMLTSLGVFANPGTPLTIGTLPSLENLTVQGAALVAIDEAPRVTHVTLRGAVKEAALVQVTKLPTVEHLEVMMGPESDPSSLSLIESMAALSVLTVHIKDAAVDAAAHLRFPAKLHELSLHIAHADLTRLSELINASRDLQRISLYDLKGTQGDVLQFDNLYRLKRLGLYSLDVDTLRLWNLPRLTGLYDHGCQIGSLSLRNTHDLPLHTVLQLFHEQKNKGIRSLRIEDHNGNQWTLQASPPGGE